MSDEKIVTHADLPVLRSLRTEGDPIKVELLDRLIAAAEADAPPLPEGWYLWATGDGASHTAVYVKGAKMTRWDDGNGEFGSVTGQHDRLTPLRPTVNEADLQRAITAFCGSGMKLDGALRTAFDAAGIEVSGQ